MKIIPAIDLLNGQCVRLKQGDFAEVTTYQLNSIKTALKLAEQGATECHVVDLNGAKYGESNQYQLIIDIKQQSGITLQVGGGLRNQTAITNLLDNGIDRVVLGSIAITQPEIVKQIIEKYSASRFVLALDVAISTLPMVVINGWRESGNLSLWEILKIYEDYSDLTILCTDIACDGMLAGPNFELYRNILLRYPNLKLQASGGISDISELISLKNLQLSAAIVGKALYEQKFSLTQALQEIALC